MKAPSLPLVGLLVLLTVLPTVQAGPNLSRLPTEHLVSTQQQDVVCVHLYPRPYFALFVQCGAGTASVIVTPGGVQVCVSVPLVACKVMVKVQKDLPDIISLP